MRQNQEHQSKIRLLESRIRSREADVVDLAVQLKSAETILQQALEQTASCVSAIKLAQKTRDVVSVHDLINYSSKLAYTSGKTPGTTSMVMEPFPSLEIFPFGRLMKELLPQKEEQVAMEGISEAEHTYTSFLGDLGTTQAPEDEDLADF